MRCDQCRKKVGSFAACVVVAPAGYDFCSVACLVLFVRTRWIEAA